MPGGVEVTIASDPRWLRLARCVVQLYCETLGVDPKMTHSIVLAVDEALANVMKHAYNGDASRKIHLTCRSVENAIEVEIRDQGRAFDPLQQEVPQPDELRVGGRGIYLIRKIMDGFEYSREGDTNCTRLSKKVDTLAAS